MLKYIKIIFKISSSKHKKLLIFNPKKINFLKNELPHTHAHRSPNAAA